MNPRRFSYAAGVAFAAGGALCWSLGGPLVRLTSNLDIWQVLFYRSAVLLVCVLIWLGIRYGTSLPARMIAAGSPAVIAGIAVGSSGIGFVIAMFYTTVAEATFIFGTSPTLSAILGLWILRERIPASAWIAIFLAAGGMAIIFLGAGGGNSMVGALAAFYCAFSIACYAVLLRWGQNSEMTVALIWNALMLIALSATVLAVPTGLRQPTGLAAFSISWPDLGVVILMGSVQLGLGMILFTVASRSVPAAQLMLISLIEPCLAPVWAWLVAGEVPSLATFIGGAAILSAIVFQALFGAASKRRHARNQQRRTA